MTKPRPPKDFVDHVEQALATAYEQGREAGRLEISWRNQSIENQIKKDRALLDFETAKGELDAIKTLSALGQTFAMLAESLAKALQSRRNQL